MASSHFSGLRMDSSDKPGTLKYPSSRSKGLDVPTAKNNTLSLQWLHPLLSLIVSQPKRYFLWLLSFCNHNDTKILNKSISNRIIIDSNAYGLVKHLEISKDRHSGVKRLSSNLTAAQENHGNDGFTADEPEIYGEGHIDAVREARSGYRCQYCGATFSTISELTLHVIDAHLNSQ